MAWYNRIFGADSPKQKKLKASKRNYTGASTGRLFADFITRSSSADADIKDNIRILRDRSRDLAKNDSYISRYLNLMVSNVIGKQGIRVSSKARLDDPVNMGKLDLGANQLIESAWKDWSKKGSCTVDGQMSFLDCQKLFVKTLLRDGEVLIRKIGGESYSHGFSIQFIEADYLDENKNEKLKNGNEIVMGVELNKHRKPVAYHLFKEHPYDRSYASSNTTERVPADTIIHAYIQDRSSQTRGVPAVSTAMANVKMLNGYLEAEIVAARVGASKMGFFTSPDGDGYVGDGEYEDTFNPTMNAQAGVFEQLPQGMDFKAFDPTHPTSAFDSFTTSVLRSISSGLNVSYHSLSNDLTSVNYSSIRQGALEDRSNYQIYQQFVIEHFINPVFDAWIRSSINRTDGLSLPQEKVDKFANSVNYIPRSFAWIDPLKEMQSNVVGLQNGTVTYSDISAAYGRDTEELFEQHQKEIELAKQYGIELAYQPFGQKQPVEANINGGDQDDE
jgi:lambda family phage portal protein